MAMFHIQYPASRDFLTWDELGCLCRALGYPASMIRDQIYEHPEVSFGDRHGILVKHLHQMVEMKLLYKVLHRTFNSHTADWNSCVITRSIFMLNHKVLDFDGLQQVRVAYFTYEHSDMKGMVLDKHVLLRTLKMCGRTISPLKLLHRCKHMKADLEEKGRIQLYEFYQLILWCDLYTAYNPEELEKASGKDEDLFKLVDFQRLLSHHDQRLSRSLDVSYLKEERDFGREALGSKEMFTEPVVHTETRLAQYLQQDEALLSAEFTSNTRERSLLQKHNYRQLKQEVGHSQRRLYRAHAGSIRSRPISAPDLDRYRWKPAEKGHVVTSAQAAYESVQRRLHSAPSKGSSRTVERPVLSANHVRAETPKVVTPRDLNDVKRKMEILQFDINTLGSRCQLQVENEMDFYIPGYREKLENRKPEPEPVPEPERKPIHWTTKIINNLAYPPSQKWPAHDKACDARYRGWKKVKSRPGWHVVLTSTTHENSEKGRMYSKMEKTTLAPVQYLHPDYVIRYTQKSQVALPKQALRAKRAVQDYIQPDDEAGQNDEEAAREETESEAKDREEKAKLANEEALRKNMETLRSKYLPEPVAEVNTVSTGRSRVLSEQGQEKEKKGKSFPRGLSAPARLKGSDVKNTFGPRNLDSHAAVGDTVGSKQPQQQQQQQEQQQQNGQPPKDTELPMPHMEHSGPKLVGVGTIGTIALLESIQESRDLEEKFVESSSDDEDDDAKDDEANNSVDNSETDLSDGEAFNQGIEIRAIGTSSRRRAKRPLSLSAKARQLILKRQRRPSKSAPSSGQRKGKSQQTVSKPRSATTPRARKAEQERKESRGKTVSRELVEVFPSRPLVSRQDNDDTESIAASESTNTDASSHITSSSYTSSSASELHMKFKGFRGSVTSEELDTPVSKTPKTPIDVMVSRQDSYSEEMTIPSSTEFGVFLESPQLRKSQLGMRGGSAELKRYGEVKFAPEIRLDMACSEQGDVFSADGVPLGRLYSSFSEREDVGPKLSTDYRDYLSDSGIKQPTQNLYSKESRSRLVGRVENVISPDLRMRLLEGQPKVSVPAS